MSDHEPTLPPHRLSVVVPMFNERDNAAEMVDRVCGALAGYAHPWELVLVDDGSSDGTPGELRAARARHGDHVRVLQLQRNYGQTAALQAGFDAARGDLAVTLDGDLQNDPRDIPIMVAELFARDLDLLVGWRRRRRDDVLVRKVPSWLANRLIRRLTGVSVHDYGCALKVFRATVFRRLQLYGEMHRFIAAWAATVTRPDRIGEMEVRHHARTHGRSKYGLERTFKVMLDLVAVFFFMRYRTKPVHFFGAIGFLVGGLGTAALVYLAGVKFLLGEDIGGRPLLLVAVVLVLAALQFVTTGVAMELMARTYFESGQATSYLLRQDPEPEKATWAGRPAGRMEA
ncbi:glycosyltransferase [bacterium]|nr:glycosyltransferase [bacterium]